MNRLRRMMRAMIWVSIFPIFVGMTSAAGANAVTLITWNVSGSVAASHDSDFVAMLALVDPDVILITEGGAGAQLSDHFTADYTLVETTSGQEIWLSNDSRFSLGSLGTGTWVSSCNNHSLDGAWAHIVDTQSSQDLFVYVPHFCISDNFIAGVDENPAVSNEDQQEALCNIIGHMEDRAAEGSFVVLGGDFNVFLVEADDSIVAFLEGTNDLDPAYCNPTTTEIGLVVGAQQDVQRIMGSGGAATYSNTISMSSGALGWGQGSHGWVAVDVALASVSAVPSVDDRWSLGFLALVMGFAGSTMLQRRGLSS